MAQQRRAAKVAVVTEGPEAEAKRGRASDPLLVQSVEKAFRILSAFDGMRPTMSLSELASATELDKSATQRFAHTLEQLGYLRKDPITKRFELTTRTLDFGHHYIRANVLAERAFPYLMHLSKTSEETVSLTVLDDTEVVYISRFVSRHMLNTDVIVGTRLPAYCTAPGVAILSRLPLKEARAILDKSDLRPYTASTTWKPDLILKKIAHAADVGYALASEEIYPGDLSVGAAILGADSRPIGALTLAVSKTRFNESEAEKQFAPLVIAAARSLSYSHPNRL